MKDRWQRTDDDMFIVVWRHAHCCFAVQTSLARAWRHLARMTSRATSLTLNRWGPKSWACQILNFENRTSISRDMANFVKWSQSILKFCWCSHFHFQVAVIILASWVREHSSYYNLDLSVCLSVCQEMRKLRALSIVWLLVWLDESQGRNHTIIWGRRDAATYVCSIFTPWNPVHILYYDHTIIYHQCVRVRVMVATPLARR